MVSHIGQLHSVHTASERPVIGLYCLIFGLYWRIQLKRTERRKGVLLYALTVNFILCTAYFIVDIIGVQFFITVSLIYKSYIIFQCHASKYERRSVDLSKSQMAVQKSDSLASASLWLSIAADALYTAIDFVSQLILVCVLHLQFPFFFN